MSHLDVDIKRRPRRSQHSRNTSQSQGSPLKSGFLKPSFMKIKASSKKQGPSGIRRIASGIISRKVCEALIKAQLGRKAGITGGSMDMDFISPAPAPDPL